MAKGEISWKGTFEDGRRRQAYAKKVGNQWRFYDREKRFDSWERILRPSLDDWLCLMDGVDRRVHRRLLQPQDAQRIRQTIKERFPETDIPNSNDAPPAGLLAIDSYVCMTFSPLVSVLLPAFNAASTILPAIRSILDGITPTWNASSMMDQKTTPSALPRASKIPDSESSSRPIRCCPRSQSGRPRSTRHLAGPHGCR